MPDRATPGSAASCAASATAPSGSTPSRRSPMSYVAPDTVRPAACAERARAVERSESRSTSAASSARSSSSRCGGRMSSRGPRPRPARRASEGRRESAKPTAPPASMAAPTSGSPSTALVTPTHVDALQRQPPAERGAVVPHGGDVDGQRDCHERSRWSRRPSRDRRRAGFRDGPTVLQNPGGCRRGRARPGPTRGGSIAPGCNLVHFSQCLYNPDDRSHHKGKSHEEHKESVTGRGDCRRSAARGRPGRLRVEFDVERRSECEREPEH